MNKELIMNPNQLVAFLEKPCAEFTKEDIKRYIQQNGIRMVNFMYPAGDGRLKTLNFVINNQAYLDAILTCGERVDGSSLFPFIEAGSSDLYVIPRFRTAFLDPFAEIPTLSMLCSFFNKDGEPLESSPEHTLHKACKAFNEVTGMEFQAMGELEYYVIAPDTNMFEATDQKGYHESAPYAKFNDFRTQCMAYIAQAGGQIKYGHSEVGNFTLNGMIYEQNEIEFLPVNAEDAADQLMIAKWIIRNLAYKHGYNITFAPKITTGKAGSGPSNLRRYIFEQDLCEAIIAIPENMFYNTGIGTYLWVLTNKKDEKRKGKVQLIDATSMKEPLRKNLGDKNCEMTQKMREKVMNCILRLIRRTVNIARYFQMKNSGFTR